MSPIDLKPCKLSSESILFIRDGSPSNLDDGGSFEKGKNRNGGNNGGDEDHRGNININTHNNNDDKENGSNTGGFGEGGFGGGGFGGGNGGFGSSNGGFDGKNNGDSSDDGKNDNNDGGGNTGGSSRSTSKFSSTSSAPRQTTAQRTPASTFEATFTITPVTTSDSESSTSLFLPPSTISSSTIILSSPSENVFMTATPLPDKGSSHILPLGSIVAIILGILFCITIAGVILVITRPKFGSLTRLWKESRMTGSYLPSTINSFEPKQQRDSSNLYRRYTPAERPFSRTFFDLQAFRFGSAGNAIAQGPAIPRQHTNLAMPDITSPPRKYDDFQAQQIYSTRMLPPSAVLKSNASRSVSSKSSKQQTYSSISGRIMSMIDSLSSDSGVGSGRASLWSYNWKPPRGDPASNAHT